MIKIAINGFGRIGRQVFKRIQENHTDIEIVAINDLTDNKTLAHLLKYDSNYGRFDAEISFTENAIIVNGKEFKTFSEKNPERLPWKDLKVDIVLECSGAFNDKVGAGKHLSAGAKKVILSGPGKDPSNSSGQEKIPGFILGVNTEEVDFRDIDIMDMGSCTTNCLAPVAKVLNDNFKIQKGFMTTIHSYTNDQRILDLPHKDLRRARSAGQNIIPTSTGAAKSIGKIIPELSGKLDGISVRVPTPTVSLLDLIIEVKNTVTKEEVSEAFKKAEKENNFKGILRTDENKLVSCDYIGDSYSAIVDLSETMVNGNMIKVIAWYDNEWAYSCRLAEFCEFVGKQL
ncbi:MAG: type I glyceraldehyde-3-phosphate dehydrogenase [Candidatus Staskawiczbacteria bacterium RIFOXYB2_FULL_32_9]|uniref:Type I glyceraldehyde-3-phosphate dehydrogenase n=1 Tax=Candidatus Staskawiczbacteria bacterium RIFOXYD1_FULL_32_13 TaxID=1802234 RepID=A0A1G2JTT9_9BACT|nr:MAG: Glyceraldehyde-3-phosphate dehydrogenase, type I [Parcubacteria group bacterium GW2011_GWC2_32_10]OGZ78877.1 MAG: type I glyceraldehyde-3-phosphate dehydrogenase [Candidatus Staskawiczbacteria bacterium RIFOXYA2_FULL_32_7]OGZ79812.1 MAG: type I glyceraldehyde-3-phosphate dehydrogenase [Candidatus Staskawiczbacteria bacterium RIFOXYB1_FULL_32_11]OGZ81053.1 MAG: type I glyceraldehyde-3-phosphate dehydrogenase [Candidatus Staskawiczbacteria bacterium RIFOXYB2_FULL_32_9]OGZ89668.1 MAG: type